MPPFRALQTYVTLRNGDMPRLCICWRRAKQSCICKDRPSRGRPCCLAFPAVLSGALTAPDGNSDAQRRTRITVYGRDLWGQRTAPSACTRLQAQEDKQQWSGVRISACCHIGRFNCGGESFPLCVEQWKHGAFKRACTVGVKASVFLGLPVLCSVITMPQMYIPHNILPSCKGLDLLKLVKAQRHSRRRKALAYA